MSLSKDNLIEILLHTNIKEYGNLAQINSSFNEILNDRHFWILKYQYNGFSETVFYTFDYDGDLQDYIESYMNVLLYRTIANNVLTIYEIESHDSKYSNNYMKLPNGYRTFVLFLDSRYPDISAELENNKKQYQQLYIKSELNKYVLYDNDLTIKLYFNKNDIVELLILYQHYGSYIMDKNNIPYNTGERPNINIVDRRAGIIAALNYLQ